MRYIAAALLLNTYQKPVNRENLIKIFVQGDVPYEESKIDELLNAITESGGINAALYNGINILSSHDESFAKPPTIMDPYLEQYLSNEACGCPWEYGECCPNCCPHYHGGSCMTNNTSSESSEYCLDFLS